MNAFDELGRPIQQTTTGTTDKELPAVSGFVCRHGWVQWKFALDGQQHKYCALCGVDLGIDHYAATNTASAFR